MRGPAGASEDHGAAAVEFALVLIPLILIIGAIVDFGFAFNAQIGLTHAAREGVRAEAVTPGTGATTAENAFTALAVEDVGPPVVRGCPDDDGAQVTLGATYNYFFLQIIPGLDSIDLEGQAVMRCGG